MSHISKKNTSFTNAILKSLRADINNSFYSAGQFITESEISEKYNVSKTPAREALNFLCQEGLLEKIPRKGYMVRTLSFQDIQNLFQLRSILERASVKLAIRYASDDDLLTLENIARVKIDTSAPDWISQYNELNDLFHMSIARMSNNIYLVEALQKVLNMLCRELARDMKEIGIEQAMESHVQIVKAIKERDPDKALRITSDQIEIVERRLYDR